LSIAFCNFFNFFLKDIALCNQKCYNVKEGGIFLNTVEIGKRIKQARDAKHITQEELGNLLGLNKSSIQRYETGKVAKIKLPILENIAFILGVNPSWLALKTDDPKFYGESTSAPGSILGSIDISALPSNIRPIHLKRFPLLGEIACGKPILAQEEKEAYVMADMDVVADFCLIAKGDSMINARIRNGDIVFIKQMEMVENGDIAAVIIDDEATLKRVYYYPEKNKLVLNPENPAFEPLVYTNEELNEIRILGKAVYFMSAV